MRENRSCMKYFKKFLVIVLLSSAFLFFTGGVSAQTTTLTPTTSVTTTLTPTSVATTTATVTATPTKVTSLPKTGVVQYGLAFAVVSIGIILFAFVL